MEHSDFLRNPPTDIPVNIERDFSKENFEGYVSACKRVGERIAEFVLDNDQSKIAIVLPSRGAIPIFIGAEIALMEDSELKNYDIGKLIEIPELSCFDRLRPDDKDAETDDFPVKTLVLPFTADVKMKGLVRPEEETKVVDNMRQFMSRVTIEFFRDPSQRESKEFSLYLRLLEIVEGRKQLAKFLREFPKVEKMLMLDTVVSGRASSTILGEFARLGMEIGKEVVPVLVVDNNGSSLKNEYRRFVDEFGSFKIPRIFSEDRGAALEGIVATVYPSLITGSYGKTDCGDIYPCFGSWHNVPEKEKKDYAEIFNLFLDVIEEGITGVKNSLETRKVFLTKLNSGGFLRKRNFNVKNMENIVRRGLKIVKVEETSAHVIQIYFPEAVTANLIRQICKLTADK
jgi:hypothetical protein